MSKARINASDLDDIVSTISLNEELIMRYRKNEGNGVELVRRQHDMSGSNHIHERWLSKKDVLRVLSMKEIFFYWPEEYEDWVDDNKGVTV